MLLHSALHWTEEADLRLWPFAMEYALFLWNNLSNKEDGLTPNEIVAQALSLDFSHLARMHVWGCPTYVLKPKLQDGHKMPKWSPCSKRGQFLGFLKLHSTQIGLI